MYLEISPISEMHRVRPDLVASEEIGHMNMTCHVDRPHV
jgi:hypothetical protein